MEVPFSSPAPSLPTPPQPSPSLYPLPAPTPHTHASHMPPSYHLPTPTTTTACHHSSACRLYLYLPFFTCTHLRLPACHTRLPCTHLEPAHTMPFCLPFHNILPYHHPYLPTMTCLPATSTCCSLHMPACLLPAAWFLLLCSPVMPAPLPACMPDVNFPSYTYLPTCACVLSRLCFSSFSPAYLYLLPPCLSSCVIHTHTTGQDLDGGWLVVWLFLLPASLSLFQN